MSQFLIRERFEGLRPLRLFFRIQVSVVVGGFIAKNHLTLRQFLQMIHRSDAGGSSMFGRRPDSDFSRNSVIENFFGNVIVTEADPKSFFPQEPILEDYVGHRTNSLSKKLALRL